MKRGLTFLLTLILCTQAGLFAAAAGVNVSDAGVAALARVLADDPDAHDLILRGNVLTFTLPDGTPVRVVETANADGSVHLEFTEGDKRDVLDINPKTRAIMMNGMALMVGLEADVTDNSEDIEPFRGEPRSEINAVTRVEYWRGSRNVEATQRISSMATSVLLEIMFNAMGVYYPIEKISGIISLAAELLSPAKTVYVYRVTYRDANYSGGWKFVDDFYLDETHSTYVDTAITEQWTSRR